MGRSLHTFVGTILACLGTAPSCWSQTWTRQPVRSRPRAQFAEAQARTHRSCSPRGLRRASCILWQTLPVGGISTNRALTARWSTFAPETPSSPVPLRGGGSAARTIVFCRTAASSPPTKTAASGLPSSSSCRRTLRPSPNPGPFSTFFRGVTKAVPVFWSGSTGRSACRVPSAPPARARMGRPCTSWAASRTPRAGSTHGRCRRQRSRRSPRGRR
mmetsp:Transcript_113312/g.284948  ORF Transcript_113312/g.284948 Transcript_113312/m.284948 type:complete len:216 (+) Transcript_113312:845-1492(+)